MSLTPFVSGSGADVVTVDAPSSAVQADEPSAPVLGGRETARSPLPPPQQVEPQTTLVAKEDRNRTFRVDSPRGGHEWTVSALASHDLPQAALTAYRNAAATTARLDPSCRLGWTLLAGIGRVESDHGRYGGSVLSSDGVSRPEIIGVALNGRGPVAAIRDTDNGRLDGDRVWDRAVGPMQFIPSTWEYAGRDGDDDGTMDPHDLDDTALAAAAYLCSGSGSMLDDASARTAIFRYNPSDYYVALVQAFERGYRTGVFEIPSPPAEGADKPRARHRGGDRDRTADNSVSDGPPERPERKPSAQDEPAPRPSPKPAPSPSPTPEPPEPEVELVSVTGTLDYCGGGFCLDARLLDLGPQPQLSALAGHDFDGDGGMEANVDEIGGLVGRSVTVRVGGGTGPAVVYVLEGHDYRFADGTFA